MSLISRLSIRQLLISYGHRQQSQIRSLSKVPKKHRGKVQSPLDDKDLKEENEKDVNQDKLIRWSNKGSTQQDSQPLVENSTEVLNEQNAEEKKSSGMATKEKDAKEKMHELLASLSLTEIKPQELPINSMLSKPRGRKQFTKSGTAKGDTGVEDAYEESKLEPELVGAAEDVAESLGGDVHKTKSDLLSSVKFFSKEEMKMTLEEDLRNMNSAISKEVDKPDFQKKFSKQEKQRFANISKLAMEIGDKSELFLGMKIDRTNTEKNTFERSDSFKWDMGMPHTARTNSFKWGMGRPRKARTEFANFDREYFKADRPAKSRQIDVEPELFGENKLNIFNIDENVQPTIGESVLPVWDRAHQRELKLTENLAPRNGFMEMINWTNEGKLWTFPIDNEVGLEEREVGFHEHIFLENHLEGWCPKRGPIRHFMELVCVGLSKNPYMTVERKKRHIQWYKEYFEAKKDILEGIGIVLGKQ